MTGVTVRQQAGVASLTGARGTNQDSYLLEDRAVARGPVLALLGVADGMGGHEAGDVASRVAMTSASQALDGAGPDSDSLRRAILTADAEIRALGSPEGGRSRMGTTLTLTVVTPTQALVGHVGDSRAYLYHQGELRQVTTDHSRVGRLVETGVISESEARGHPESNVLDQALGAGEPPDVDVYRVGCGPRDVILLSTDGLHGVLSREEMAEVLGREESMQAACDRLAVLAKQRGSQDDITVLAWQYPPPARRTPTDPGTLVRPFPDTEGPGQASVGVPVPPAARRGILADVRVRILVGALAVGFVAGYLLRWIG